MGLENPMMKSSYGCFCETAKMSGESSIVVVKLFEIEAQESRRKKLYEMGKKVLKLFPPLHKSDIILLYQTSDTQ